MEVVNVRVANIRPEGYQNLAQWVADPRNAYIGRRGVVFIDGKRFPEADSPFANPFKIGRDGSREDVLRAYETYIREQLAKSAELREQLRALQGKRLGCWCAPEPCHGDVLMRLSLFCQPMLVECCEGSRDRPAPFSKYHFDL
jgi:hypothetical protein